MGRRPWLGKTFCEAVDGVFSMRSSGEWFLDVERLKVPVLLGHTDSEFFTWPDLMKTGESSEEYARRLFGSDAGEFLACFSDPASPESISREGGINSIEFAVRAAARRFAKQGEKTPLYYYMFCPEIPGWDHPGAFHSSDLWFFFETLAKCWRPFTGKHYDLARQMCDYWCNFIKNGDPNGEDLNGNVLPSWPSLDPRDPVRMRFGDTAMCEKCPETPLMAFLQDRFAEKA